jgi:hypothetical protein
LQGIRGAVSQFELGTSITLQPDFEILLSALSTLNRLDQSRMSGIEEMELDPQRNLPLTRRSLDARTDDLPIGTRQLSYGASLTVRLLF